MTTLASANILYTLAAPQAAEALELVLAEEPDLVALQEWYVSRLPILRRYGDVRLATVGRLPSVPVPAGRGGSSYHWVTTLADGNGVGARADRFDLLEARAVLNVGPARSERPDRFLRTEPPRFVALGIFRDRVVDRTVAVISYHLSAGVQSRGRYRADRPLLAARHQQEIRGLERLVAELQRDGHVVHAAGDSNLDGLRLAGLTSAWVGREDEPGTHGRGKRKIDDVHGPGPALDVRRVVTASDHQAILVTRKD
ncbi:hypothetical protein EFK50_04700 [Nocardioides marmoriginsengisoli]|uniref:Endonuclease/exonuclease/phosphatase family protein n=1 Tax=Nocardioides marmoriginsengisoli TaxID=661483 RepID=A0A3N0CQS8_9ACTN|nr:hypothetical protein [Nocardioides marmoriginsengisoli]RNL65263.1 hypothetical protein EFK50_04700 [Nocardioides marmoriginsengisoli]